MPQLNVPLQRAALVRKPRLSNQIYDLLRAEIRSGKHQANVRFTEPAIARELNTSRTPVREALFQLVNNGLLCEFDRGYGLPRLSAADVGKMMALRMALEDHLLESLERSLTAARLEQLRAAVARERRAHEKGDQGAFIDANNAFRELLYEFADNSYLRETAELYSDRLQIFRVMTLAGHENRGLVLTAHEQVLAALEQGDTQQARAVHRQMLLQAGAAYATAARELVRD